MIQLIKLEDNKKLYTGTIIRVYDVKRLDVMKTKNDLSDPEKQKRDFYDYMLVDANVISNGVFLLINVTLDNANKGSILCSFEAVDSKYSINSVNVKKYFDNSTDVYIM